MSDRRTKQVEYAHNMDDLEVDCAPVAGQRAHENLPQHMHKLQKHVERTADRFDSGIDSYNSMGFVSGEICRTEQTVSDVEKTLDNLKISSDSKCVELRSFDEGYCDTFDSHNLESIPEIVKARQEIKTVSEAQRNADELVEIFSQDRDGDSQLHMAIIQLLPQVAMYFISKAPQFSWLNLTNDLLQTPLHLAVITRMKDIVRRLVVGGASVDMRDHKGDTALHIASREGFDEIAATMMEPVRQDEVQEVAYDVPYQMIPQDLEARNYEGQTCLHLAAEGAHLPVLKLLLSKGANINAQDGKSGRTSLHYAAETGNMVLLEFLLIHPRLNVNAKTYGGFTPVMLAQGRGHQHVINRLVSAGAIYDPDFPDDSDSEEEMDSYDDICIGGQRISSP